jgi:hypothetical protein
MIVSLPQDCFYNNRDSKVHYSVTASALLYTPQEGLPQKTQVRIGKWRHMDFCWWVDRISKASRQLKGMKIPISLPSTTNPFEPIIQVILFPRCQKTNHCVRKSKERLYKETSQHPWEYSPLQDLSMLLQKKLPLPRIGPRQLLIVLT